MASVQDTHVDLEMVPRISSSTLRPPSGFTSSTLTKISVGAVVVAVLIIAGVLTAVFLTTNILKNSEITTAVSTTSTTVTTTTTTTSTTTTATTTTTTTTTTTATTITTTTTTTTTSTTSSRRVFALSQVINGQTVTCSSVVNTNSSFTECDDLQQGGLYGSNGITCTNAWSTTQASTWATIGFCQAFLNSSNTYIEAFYDCSASQTRFTWSSGGAWGTTTDNGYTKHLRCYY